MSLDYNWRNCKLNAADCTDSEFENLRSIVFGTMSVGINDLGDETKARKFYQRYSAMYYVQGLEPFVSWDWLRDNLVGLTTNASPMTEAQFVKRLGICALDYANAKLNQKPSKPLQSV